ncbi:MAG TPA: histidine kinase [Ferruginibacter sp.]|jgi:two-component system LytT family sensor kinase|nr:histidine kinase [Ferruginibacter sp.]
MGKINSRYWLCQILGWGVWGLIALYFNLVVFGDRFKELGGKNEFLISLSISLILGIVVTHLLKTFIKKNNWLQFSYKKIVLLFVIGVAASGIILFYGDKFIEHSTNYSYDRYLQNKKLEKAKRMETQYGLTGNYYVNETKNAAVSAVVDEIKNTTSWYRDESGVWVHDDKRNLLGIYQNLLLIAIWLLIYIVYHYVEKNTNDELDKLRLESTVKELELKTIKSHINPHFIFNSLNSIRALVDENPARARTAITELSNILRSSMHAGKSETVPFEKELNIVKDYLALEHMRFEERLKIEFNIDKQTLVQQVPPMMLQTLVENGIKHGISKSIHGGLVKITSQFREDNLELIVQNSGQLNGGINKEGFGIQSTEDRLNLLYHGKASFEIKNLNNETVQSKVSIPINA